MERVDIPRRVDDPPHLLLWSADELAPLMIGLTIGVVIGKALLMFIIGLVVAKLYARFRDNHPDGYLLHLFYKFGFMKTKARSFINPYIRDLIP